MLEEGLKEILIAAGTNAYSARVAKRAMTSRPIVGADGRRVLKHSTDSFISAASFQK